MRDSNAYDNPIPFFTSLDYSFQELDLSAEAYIVFDGSKEEEWTRAIADSLGSGYKKIMSKQLVGLLIVMFAAEDHVDYIKEVTTHSAGVGIMGILVRTMDRSSSNLEVLSKMIS